MPLLPLLILAASSAGSQVPAAPSPAASTPAYVPRRGGRLFISPMGEPFRPDTREASGLAEWFNQADRNHDGRLMLDEMQGDADRFFAILDVNHDGEIDPDEIEHYETAIAPEIASGAHFEAAAIGAVGPGEADGGRRDGHGGHRHGGGGFSRDSSLDGHQGASRFGLLDLPEPVTAADANFNRGVSREEFQQAAGQRFLALDLDHHGYLTLGDLEKIRPAPAAQPNHDFDHDSPSGATESPPVPDHY